MAKTWYTDGRAGELCSSSMSVWAGLPRRWPNDEDPGWFVDPVRTVGGAWVDHAVYQIDLLRWILGEEVISVSRTAAKLCHKSLEVEDYGVALVVFSGGLVATLEDTWTSPTGGFQSSSLLVGSVGALDMNDLTDRQLLVGRDRPAPGWVETKQPPPHDQSADIDHLVEVIWGETEPIATVEDAWRNLAACMTFYESARTGRVMAPAELTR